MTSSTRSVLIEVYFVVVIVVVVVAVVVVVVVLFCFFTQKPGKHSQLHTLKDGSEI